ncbi:hypothetical protein [Kitasatospora sp. CB01950]|uniref:hypothetical protein n=1 Tax=Kitasatospora sp. CB01950 TaxID=1703930 RepID=UPI000B238BEF|nr:hypothetical protein [Kitasatospora sp. CB01950]
MSDNDGRMRLRLTSHRVGDEGHRLNRVLSSGPMLRNTFLHPPRVHVGYLFAPRADLLRLGALFRIAAAGPHTAVHVPAPPSTPPDAAPRLSDGSDSPALPLLIAREDTGLRPSDWPALRRRMHRTATPLTATAPAPRPHERPEDVHRRCANRPARFTEHAGTVVVTARAELLFWIGDLLTAAGRAVATDREIHRRGESYFADLVGLFEPRYTEHPMHALCVVAVDPIFHKSRWHKHRRPATAR